MWDTTEHDFNAGGGFFNNTTTNETDSPTKQKTGAKRAQSVVPVVIRQIRDHPQDELSIFNLAAPIVELVGILKDYEVQSTKVIYNIQDHTGTLRAIWWLENEGENTTNLPVVKEGSYVQIFGSLRNQEGERLLMILKMFAIDDCNYITNHLLKVIHVRLQAEVSAKSSVSEILLNNPGAELATSMSRQHDNGVDSGEQHGFTPVQAKIYRMLKVDVSQHGVSRSAIYASFPANLHGEVKATIEFLLNEGHAYTTVDNDHFKSTDL